MQKFLKKLVGKNVETAQPAIADIPTLPIPKDQIENELKSKISLLENPQLIVGFAQSIGRQRDHNEDALFTMTMNLTKEKETIHVGLFIVADGMGGHKQGEVASGLTVRLIGAQVIRKVILNLLGVKPHPPSESLQEILRNSVEDAHQTIIKHSPGSGTTLTALLIVNEQMTIIHVGDSRAYLIKTDGSVQLLTRDHSLVMRMIELGQLTKEEAGLHPQRNVLYKALGQGEGFIPDIATYPLPDAGSILLCSDGLWGVTPESRIIEIIAGSPDPHSACQQLVDAANEAGGPDNITAVLVRLPG